ncbi:Mak10-domain-containing protein [Artomyces pyxidatus]|uniref:Mak10-domain-containing protein n=1 Tax=Artomyces pyxidatus TaxID=48021 RepID=A0ACB8T0A2_9AGAM|nr:Mak10-domain-containing protein [Artomyces pyxidatus]
MSYAMPGGDGFVDVTDILVEASIDMDPETMILTENFTLYDSMSALEIGDPRMDSGIALDEEQRPDFQPLAPLLPEELCYILDRLLACEMEWHSGFTLAQTVFTSLHVHQLDELDPDTMPPMQHDPSRPIELVTIVLRAAVTGFLKSCDLAWRELSKGRVQDTEDWQSEKTGVSLLEGLPVGTVLARLEDARVWIVGHTHQSMPWRDHLLDRILLRAHLIELFRLHPIEDGSRFQTVLSTTTAILQAIHNRPPIPSPNSSSPAVLAFDPYITRRLSSIMPLRVLELPPLETTWAALASLLRGLSEVGTLVGTPSLMTWKVVGDLRSTFPLDGQRIPFLRSLTQSCFFDGHRVLGKMTLDWLVDRFFLESIGVPYHILASAVKTRWPSSSSPPFRDIEQKIIRTLIPHIKSAWYNPPRRRRFLSRSLLEWHAMYDAAVTLVGSVNTDDVADSALVLAIPRAVLLWQLSIVREVVLSGFAMELYVPHERPFAYWYASQVMKEQLSVLEQLESVIPNDVVAREEIAFDRSFLAALEAMCFGMFVITLPEMSCSGYRLSLNFLRRYKWAFRPEYKIYSTPLVVAPDLDRFLSACADTLEDESISPSTLFSRAKARFLDLGNSQPGYGGLWHIDRQKFVRDLADVAGQLALVSPATLEDLPAFQPSNLEWDFTIYRWFPISSAFVGVLYMYQYFCQACTDEKSVYTKYYM